MDLKMPILNHPLRLCHLFLSLFHVIVGEEVAHLGARLAANRMPKRARTDVLDYIENDQIRVGVYKGGGGSIGYMSAAGNKQNMINDYDKGREVQLSYYADPQDYRPDVCGAVTPWKQSWPWNPIASGDVFGNSPEMKSYTKNGTSIDLSVSKVLSFSSSRFSSCDTSFSVIVS